MITTNRLPVVWRNVRSTKTWRPRDMLNWHRMVRSLRDLPAEERLFDFFQLVVDMCSSFAIDYLPETQPPVPPSLPPAVGAPGVAIFVDAPDHLSGVATTLGQWAGQAEKRGLDLTLYHGGRHDLFPRGIRFPPMGTLRLGAYQGLELFMPVVGDVLRVFAQRLPAAVHVSTPGPMGLLGLMCARRFGRPAYGTYHTDFPSYAAKLSDHPDIEQTSWGFMRWFYRQLQRVAVPSPSTRELLARNGIDARRVHVVGRGIDTTRFSPVHRDHALRTQWGGTRMHWLLYVGRLSREKNLNCLAAAFRLLVQGRTDVGLVITGDGPYRPELERDLAGLPVVFTGVQRGEALARTYASADLFAFPSETDTLGIVLLEAQSSGLPVVVAAAGGPKDCMVPGGTGWVVDPLSPERLAHALDHALADARMLARMSEAARAHAAGHTWARSFSAFWDLHTLPATAAQGAHHG